MKCFALCGYKIEESISAVVNNCNFNFKVMFFFGFRIEELTSELLEEKKLAAKMKIDRDKWEKQTEAFRKVLSLFWI